jgi:hypothetical protein
MLALWPFSEERGGDRGLGTCFLHADCIRGDNVPDVEAEAIFYCCLVR